MIRSTPIAISMSLCIVVSSRRQTRILGFPWRRMLFLRVFSAWIPIMGLVSEIIMMGYLPSPSIAEMKFC
jgi:hypothetical protein